jgi:hypothetical protein
MRMPVSEGEEEANADCAMLGTLADGNVVGDGAGAPVGRLEGPVDSFVVGWGVNEFVGVLDGCGVVESLGNAVGGCEGATLGIMVGFSDGCCEGAVVGQDET